MIAAGGPVHALGTRHSFTDLPDTTGTLLDLAGLTGGFALDRDARTVTVAAGTRYGELALWLDEPGLRPAQPRLAAAHLRRRRRPRPAPTARATRTGSSTSAVRSIRYVGADGDVHEVRHGEPDFDALAVGLGAFGVIVSVTLAIQPTYRVRQDVYQDAPWDAVLERVRRDHRRRLQRARCSRGGSRDLLGDVWVKTRVDADDDPAPDALLGGSRVVDANPLDGLPDLTVLGGVPGPWMERLPHFRLDGQPSFGDEIQSEYFVARSDAPPRCARCVSWATGSSPYLFVSELRTAASDDLWLSRAYQRDFLAIHFTWRNDDAGVRAVLPAHRAGARSVRRPPALGQAAPVRRRRHRPRASAAGGRPCGLRPPRPRAPLRERAPGAGGRALIPAVREPSLRCEPMPSIAREGMGSPRRRGFADQPVTAK